MSNDNIFAKFNEQVDLEGMKDDIKGASEGSGEFKDIPHGTYEVAIDKMEQVMTKKAPQRPMLSIWFKILDGEFKGNRIFMNQLLTGGFPIHIANEFMRSLDSGLEIEFEDYVQYYNLILDVFEQVEGKKEYALKKEDNKGFDKFTIEQVFDVQ